MTFPFPFRPATTGGGTPDAVVAFLGSGGDASDLTSYSIATASTTAACLCVAVFRITSASNRTISGTPTIGGVNATQALVVGSNTPDVLAIYYAELGSGVAATVAWTMSGSCVVGQAATYQITNYTSTTPTDTASDTVADPVSSTIDVSAGGVLIGAGSNASTGTATWTGPTEDLELITDSRLLSTASAAYVAAQTNLTVTCDFSAAQNRPRLGAVAWR